MPMNCSLYPDNWVEIAVAIKDEAGWICLECKRPCRRTGESLDKFVYRSWMNEESTAWNSLGSLSYRCSIAV